MSQTTIMTLIGSGAAVAAALIVASLAGSRGLAGLLEDRGESPRARRLLRAMAPAAAALVVAWPLMPFSGWAHLIMVCVVVVGDEVVIAFTFIAVRDGLLPVLTGHRESRHPSPAQEARTVRWVAGVGVAAMLVGTALWLAPQPMVHFYAIAPFGFGVLCELIAVSALLELRG